jgi:hypothetical protein
MACERRALGKQLARSFMVHQPNFLSYLLLLHAHNMKCDTTLLKNTLKLFCTEIDEEDPERDGGTLYRKYPPNVAHKTGAMIIVFWLLICILVCRS